jgi:hypothetical protein
MRVADFDRIWGVLNEASCEVIDARLATTPEMERLRLRAALVQVRKAERELRKMTEEE